MTVTPAVIQPSTSTGDAIPLMVSSTSGRNNAASYRDGLITSMGLPIATTGDAYPRAGVLGRQMSAVSYANGINSFLVHAPTVPNGLQFVVEPGSAIVQSSGSSGGYLVDSKTALTLTLDAANASNPRIDRVYLQVSDILALAASSLVQVAVVTGAPAATPTTPQLPIASTGVQYLDLGTIRVPAAATNLTSATFFDTRRGTSINGLPRPMLGNDLLTDAGAVPGERRIRSVTGYGTVVDEWGYDSTWHGTKILIPSAPAWQNGTTDVTMSTSAHSALLAVSVLDPGYAYYVEVSANIAVTNTASWSGFPPPAVDGLLSLTSPTGTKIGSSQGSGYYTAAFAGYNVVIPPKLSAQLTGAQTVILSGMNLLSAVGGSMVCAFSSLASNTTWLNVKVIPA